MTIKQPLELTKQEQDVLWVRIPSVFVPDQPITTKQLFAGRKEQITEILKVVLHPGGRHIVVYGERGVGKTSLTRVLPDFIGVVEKDVVACRINCSTNDTFDSVWKKMFSEIAVTHEQEEGPVTKTITETIGDTAVTPHVVQKNIESICGQTVVVLIFDEFDTITDRQCKHLFAETIKSMSDHGTKATIVLVGVGDNVNEIIAEHESIERNLSQIQMPRMSPEEANDILVINGVDKIGMGIEDMAAKTIVKIAQGLPHYIHALGLYSALSAADQLRRNVSMMDVDKAIKKTLSQSHQSLQTAYTKAVASPKANLFKEALLSCALAPANDLGYFTPSDVRDPFRLVTHESSYDIPNFLLHLNAFCLEERGPALRKDGTPRNFRYRFRKALLQPFVIMKGLDDGILTHEQLDQLA